MQTQVYDTYYRYHDNYYYRYHQTSPLLLLPLSYNIVEIFLYLCNQGVVFVGLMWLKSFHIDTYLTPATDLQLLLINMKYQFKTMQVELIMVIE